MLGVVRPAFASPRVPGQSCSSAVHSPSSRAVVARGKVNFLLWSPGQQPRAGRVFFLFFFVGAPGAPGVVSGRATACPPGFFLWAYDKYTYSAGRSSSGNAQSGDVEPA